jgi:hypothetical protein
MTPTRSDHAQHALHPTELEQPFNGTAQRLLPGRRGCHWRAASQPSRSLGR